MKRHGFTLVELLLVLVLVSVVTVSSILVFNETSNSSDAEKKTNAYMDIQRAAMLYLDLNDSWIMEFNENDEVTIKVADLVNQNFISSQIKTSVNTQNISEDYLVKIYITKYGYVDTCVIDYVNDKKKCIADSDGNVEPKEDSCCIN